MNNLLALLTLQNVPNIGDGSIKKLIQVVGSAEGILKEKKANLLKIDGIGSVKIASIHNSKHQHAAEKELAFTEQHKVNVIPYTDSQYPQRLTQCIDGPIILFSSGNIQLGNQPIISIVGTRKVTRYGVQ